MDIHKLQCTVRQDVHSRQLVMEELQKIPYRLLTVIFNFQQHTVQPVRVVVAPHHGPDGILSEDVHIQLQHGLGIESLRVCQIGKGIFHRNPYPGEGSVLQLYKIHQVGKCRLLGGVLCLCIAGQHLLVRLRNFHNFRHSLFPPGVLIVQADTSSP